MNTYGGSDQQNGDKNYLQRHLQHDLDDVYRVVKVHPAQGARLRQCA